MLNPDNIPLVPGLTIAGLLWALVIIQRVKR